MGVIETKDMSKWYGDVIAVNDITVDVQPGVTGLLGPNGAGKSTLMRLAMGLMKPSLGAIQVLGEDPWDNPKLLARIGYVPEGDAPWRDQTGKRALVIGGRLAGVADSDVEARADAALAKVGLTSQADKKVDAYSRGMRQRLKFALALLHEPEVLILDEPLLGTDPLTRRDLIQLVKDLAAQGKSILVSTHVLPDVEVMTERILLMNHGRVMAHGKVHEIRDLLERYPRTVRVGTTAPRALAALLVEWDSVLSVELDDASVLVRTKKPQAFFEELQRALAKTDLPFTSITSPDDNVEAIFRYLVG